mgnify:CR=1 FL=1
MIKIIYTSINAYLLSFIRGKSVPIRGKQNFVVMPIHRVFSIPMRHWTLSPTDSHGFTRINAIALDLFLYISSVGNKKRVTGR